MLEPGIDVDQQTDGADVIDHVLTRDVDFEERIQVTEEVKAACRSEVDALMPRIPEKPAEPDGACNAG